VKAKISTNIMNNDNSFSVPDLFIQNFPKYFLNGEQQTYKNSNEDLDRWLKSKLFTLHQFINTEKIDVVFIDTAPLYRTTEGIHQTVYEECKVWLSSFNAEIAETLIKTWQINNICQQESLMTVFLHPSFSGLFPSSGDEIEWGKVSFSKFFKDSGYSYSQKHKKAIQSKYKKWLDIHVKKVESDLFEKGLQSTFINKSIGYSYIKLKDLFVPNFVEYYKGLSNARSKDSLLRRIPELENTKYRSIINQYDGKYGGLIEALFSPDIVNSLRQELLGVLSRDLELCYLTLHRRIDNQFESILNNKINWSALIGVPLVVQKSQDSSVRIEDIEFTFPKTYRGGIWIYAASYREFSSEQESHLIDIAKLSWLLYMDQYTLKVAKEEEKVGKQSQASTFVHQAAGLAAEAWCDESRSKLDYQTQVSLWHLNSLFILWSSKPLYPDKHIFERDELVFPISSHYSSLSSDIDILNVLIRMSFCHAIRRACYVSNDEDDSLREKVEDLALELRQKSEALDELSEQLGLNSFGNPTSIPEWIRTTGFVLCFHHCLWQAVYHAIRAKCDEQSLPLLQIHFTSKQAVISNKGKDLYPNQTPFTPRDREFFDILERRTENKFTIEGPKSKQNSNGWWETIISRV
jgi:hypothetical protein